MQNKVKMLKTTLGCDDGVVIPSTYREGEQYDIGDSLLTAFVDMGVVELVQDGPAKRETKVVSPDETKPDAAHELKEDKKPTKKSKH